MSASIKCRTDVARTPHARALARVAHYARVLQAAIREAQELDPRDCPPGLVDGYTGPERFWAEDLPGLAYVATMTAAALTCLTVPGLWETIDADDEE